MRHLTPSASSVARNVVNRFAGQKNPRFGRFARSAAGSLIWVSGLMSATPFPANLRRGQKTTGQLITNPKAR